MKKIYITKEQIDNLQTLINESEGKNSMLLNEENKGQRKKCVENIINNTPGIIRRFLDMELTNLPPQMQTMLNPDGALFKAVSNNQTGANKFIDYLRLNLYKQFGIGRNSNLTQFIPGISRIACADCHFYAFDLSIDGGKILELSRILRFIDKKPEYMLSDITLDANLNGLSYDEFMETFENKIKNYISNVKDKLSSDEYRVVNTSDYTIIPIEDRMVDRHGGKVLIPTTNGRKILDKIGRYTDWCVCNNQYANEEFSKYLSNGGKMYVCAKKGFEKIKKPDTTNTPLDEYGLSLINVIIDQDGLPSNVTTRYNHDFGGENHNEMWEATHLQRLLNVNFFDVFKPRNKEELRQLHLSENKVPAAQDQVKKRVNAGIMDSICSGVLEEIDIEEYFNSDKECAYLYENKNKSEQTELKKCADEISEFMKNNGLNVFPYPEIEFNYDEQNGLFILTGYYLPSDKKIVLFCKDRHPKDILRSFAHEMIHHMQNLEGKNLNFSNKDDVKDNKELEKLESEAYLKGNIYFRKWTEYERQNDKNILSERILSVSELKELTKKLDEGERWTIYAPIVDESLEPNEVDLSSFNIKKNLNPKFWKNDLLDSRIRMKLLDIADDFIEFLGVDWVKPEDITITGSLANYNWSQKHSDIDLHIIMDYSKVDERTDFVENYFYSQKKLWNEEHKDLKIFGFPIEVYVQDVKQNHTSNGVYSLEKNEWLTEPDREKLSSAKINKTKIKNSVSKYTEEIDKLIDELSDSENDEYKIRNVSEKSEKLFDEIKKKRKNDLSKSKNEINNGNIIFKCLRRLGYIEKIDNVINKCYNKLNSLP